MQDEGIPFDVALVLFEDPLGGRPPTDGALAVDYAELVGVEREFPVTVDLSGLLIDSVPWDESLPGKCVVSRELEILHCWEAVDNEEGLAFVREDWETSR